MNKRNLEILVGLFVLLGAAALLFLALKAANLTSFASGGDTYTVQARFDNIGGLKTRAPVRSAGVYVGRVQFPRDSTAKILTAGLLGDQYIGIEPGGDEQELKAGDTLSRTQSAVVLENLIGQFLFNRAADGPGE